MAARVVQVFFLIGALFAVALPVSVSRHAVLVGYGLGLTDAAVLWLIAGLASLALVWAGLGWLSRRLRGLRVWVLAVAVPLCMGWSAFSVFAIYNLEVKYEKGESSLPRLAAFCRDLPAWQSRAARLRAGILRAAQVDPLRGRTPLNAVIHSRRQRNGYAVENVILETFPGCFLAGNLYRPLRVEDGAKIPVVLIPQGHFPKDRFNEDTQQLAATFARMGAMAFLYDMVGRGESTQVSHKSPHALTLQLWNSMRCLDFLLALPDADPGRVGMTGASGGGTQTLVCTAVDDRVTVSAPVVMVSSWVYGGCECESGLPIHGFAGYRTNNAEIAALAAPRPQLVVSIDQDWTRTVPQREFPYLRGIYRLFDKADLVCNVHLAGERHDFGPSKREAVYRFFAAHLGLALERVSKSDGRIDESPNGIEAREAMLALDDAHPLPGNAPRGWDAVMASFNGR